ncbi:short-chain dehydrogenase [Cladorrhinum sp. PSN332]|nr:short-chain dehydrogenase [Cladorrhinum sp. PSN332]
MDPLTALGLAGNIVQFIEVGSKLVKRLSDFRDSVNETPQAYRQVKAKLPLIVEGLDRIKDQAESGLFKPSAEASLVLVIRECCRAANELIELLDRAIPSVTDSNWQRMGKGIVSLTLDKKLNTLDHAIKQYTDVLEFHQIVWLVGAVEAKSLTPEERSSTFWLVPFDRNSSFVGRNSVFQAIDEAFTVSEGSQPKAALCGLGGIGKSQVALEYCYRVKGKVSVFWVNAATASRFKESFNLIANECGLTDRNDSTSDGAQMVHDWLQYRYDKPWVMVVDNIDDSRSFFETQISAGKTPWGCIPRNSWGTLLFTTRAHDIARRVTNSSPKAFIRILKLEEEDAFRLVQRRMEEGSPQDDKLIHKLLEELEYIPLAITQALAYILDHDITIGDYLDEYYRNDATKFQLLSFDFTDHGREENSLESVAKTWSISFKSIANKDLSAAKLLCLVSYFQHQSIPRELMLDVQYHYRDDQGNLKAKVITEDDLRKALVTLRAYSFLNFHGDKAKNTLSTHRLVQITTKWWLEGEGLDEIDNWPFIALRSVARCFPGPAMQLPSNYWEACQPLLPHADMVLKYSFDRVSAELQRDVDLERARLLASLGRYLISTSDYNEARACLEESSSLREKHLGEGDIETMASMGLLVWLLGSLGIDVPVGIQLGERLLKLRTEILGRDHPQTIDVQSDLAGALARTPDMAISLSMQRDAVERSERVLGRHHPDTLNCMAQLASVLSEPDVCTEDNLAESISLWREVCREKAKSLDEKHEDLLASRHNLALVLMAIPESVEEGLALLRRALQVKTGVLGVDHRETLVTAHALIFHLQKHGQTQEAYELSDKFVRESENGPRKNNEHSQRWIRSIEDLRGQIEAELVFMLEGPAEEGSSGSETMSHLEGNNDIETHEGSIRRDNCPQDGRLGPKDGGTDNGGQKRGKKEADRSVVDISGSCGSSHGSKGSNWFRCLCLSCISRRK